MFYEAASNFRCEPETPRRARDWLTSFVREALRGVDPGSLLDDAALVVSELMTNAVRAGCAQTRVRLAIDEQHIRIAVTDDSPGLPRVIDAAPEDESGRGLRLVAALSTDWGVTTANGSKEVWAALALVPRDA